MTTTTTATTTARDLRWALDPAAFAAEALRLQPDPWQERVLRWAGQRLILMCSRQSGKSTTTSVLALHTALYQPGALVLLISPSLRQSSELFRKVAGHLATLEATTGAKPDLIEENKLSLTLGNGSRVVSLPSSEATIRGFSAVALAIFDEDAFVSDELYKAVRPMLAVSHGRLILMSTPFGKRGHFYHTWTDEGGAEWERVKVTAYDCPRITRAFLDEERRSIGELHFNAEYLCEFSESVDSLFRYDDVMGMFSDEVAPLFTPSGAAASSASSAEASVLVSAASADDEAILPLFAD